MAPSAITQLTQPLQSAASALDASLPQVGNQLRLILQELVSLATTGTSTVASSLPVDSMITAASDVGADYAFNVLDKSMTTSSASNGESSPLEAFRDRFKQEARQSMSHIAELPEHRHERQRREWSVDSSPLGSLVMPSSQRSLSRDAAGNKVPLIRL